MGKGNTTKTPANVNGKRFIVKNLVTGIFNKLNNILIANDQTHRYNVEWAKGTGYIENDYERTKSYYKLEVFITEGTGDIIPVYGANYPIPSGFSELKILEKELQAYEDLLLHGIGSLISVQHSTFLQAELAEKQRRAVEEQEDNQSNLIL